MATKEFFPGIEKIKFEGKDSKNPVSYTHLDVYKRQVQYRQIMLSFATNNNNKVYYDLIILRESSHLFEYIHF